jgi:glyoxylate/hydroxypyruvate reductase A
MAILLASDFDADETAQWLALLHAALPGESFITPGARADDVELALVANPPAGALRDLPRLAWIQSLWAGVDRLLADPTIPPSVPIVRLVDPAMNAAMAETVLWAVLSLHRGFFAYAERQRARRWQPHAQRHAGEVTVAVLGLGQMGRSAAQRLAANGYRVIGWSTHPAVVDGIDARCGEAALDGVLGAAEIVVNLLPLTPATRGLFDARRLAAMRQGASLVNLARGAHVVDADLLAVLDSGRLRHAVLDVFAIEPLPPEHRYWSHPRVTVLPHVAAMTEARSAVGVVAANVAAWRAGKMPQPVVDRARGY